MKGPKQQQQLVLRAGSVIAPGTRVLYRLDALRSPHDWREGKAVRAVRAAGEYVVRSSADGSEHSLREENVRSFAVAGDTSQLHDLSLTAETHEAALMYTVQRRFYCELPYTYVGSAMLVSVNPFKWLQHDPASGAPHPSQIAHSALAALMSADAQGVGAQQTCVVVTGQSGAGKTEAAKMVLGALAAAAGGKQPGIAIGAQLQAANVLLESFGNAATPHNGNSSRFTKYIAVRVDAKSKQIVGASIECYLLEISRVTSRGPGEGLFHIFNMIIDGLTPDERKELEVWDPTLFSAYAPSHAAAASAELPPTPFTLPHVRSAMAAVGITQQQQHDILCTLAGILHLLNVDFTAVDAHSAASVKDKAPVARAARLLGFPSLSSVEADGDGEPSTKGPPLEVLLTSVTHVVAGQKQVRSFDKSSAERCRDTLARTLYEGIFHFIVSCLNQWMKGDAEGKEKTTSSKIFGVLDIFGFEVHSAATGGGINDYEQLLINYTNEVLQRLFEEEMFGKAALEAEIEGVAPLPTVADTTEAQGGTGVVGGASGDGGSDEEANGGNNNNSTLADDSSSSSSSRCIECLTHKPNGILNVISDESALGLASTPTNLADKIFSLLKVFPGTLKKDRMAPNQFLLQHYCEVVRYTVDNFTSKNRIATSLAVMCRQSKREFVAQTYEALRSSIPRQTSSQLTLFRANIDRVLELLKRSTLFWIRCVLPNTKRSATVFDVPFALQQMKACGVVKALSILGCGYSVRVPYTEMAATLLPLLASSCAGDPSKRQQLAQLRAAWDPQEVCKYASLLFPQLQFIMGATKVFLRAQSMRDIVNAVTKAQEGFAAKLQRCGRAFAARLAVGAVFQKKQYEARLLACLQRIESEREERETLEVLRQEQLANDASSRSQILLAARHRAKAKGGEVLGKLKSLSAQVSGELQRAVTEVAAFDSHREDKELAHKEMDKYTKMYLQRALAAEQAQQQRRAAEVQRRRNAEMEKERRMSVVYKDERACEERRNQLVKVLTAAKGAQVQAETAAAAVRVELLAAERKKEAKRAVAQHLEQAQRQIVKRAELREKQRERLEAAERSVAEVSQPRNRSVQRRAGSTSSTSSPSPFGSWEMKKELWGLWEHSFAAAENGGSVRLMAAAAAGGARDGHSGGRSRLVVDGPTTLSSSRTRN